MVRDASLRDWRAIRGAFRFGDFELDPANCVLRHRSTVVKLGPQPLTLLNVLVSRAGQLVTRDELRRALWDDQTNVDYEHGLNTCIRQLRVALASHGGADLIATVPRLGYRFTASVQHVDPAADRRASTIRRLRWASATVVVAAAVIAATVYRTSVSPPGSAAKIASSTRVPEAHELYIRCRAAAERGGPGTRLALQLCEQAVARDPDLAAAHATIAEINLVYRASLDVPLEDQYHRAKEASDRALALDPALPEAHLAAAHVKSSVHDWTGAEQELRRAIELQPARAAAREEYAIWLSLHGRFVEAIAQADESVTLEPNSPISHYTAGMVRRFARQCRDARPHLDKALELDPQYGPAHHEVGQCHEMAGRLDLAIEAYRRGEQNPGNLGHALALAGRTAEARAILTRLLETQRRTHSVPGAIAQIYVGLGEYDQALDWLEAGSFPERSPGTLKVAAVWDPLRSDPRFAEILRKRGFGNGGVSPESPSPRSESAASTRTPP